MIRWTDFKKFDADPAVSICINRQYDKSSRGSGGRLSAHEVGWNIRVRQSGQKDLFGILHAHWKPKDRFSEINHNISLHFKDSHASQKRSGKSNHAEIPHPDDSLLYNRFAILNAAYTAHFSADKTRPKGAATGWTSLSKAWITSDMVAQFRQLNEDAALLHLGRNDLYKLNNWDKDGWNSYMWWMAGA